VKYIALVVCLQLSENDMMQRIFFVRRIVQFYFLFLSQLSETTVLWCPTWCFLLCCLCADTEPQMASDNTRGVAKMCGERHDTTNVTAAAPATHISPVVASMVAPLAERTAYSCTTNTYGLRNMSCTRGTRRLLVPLASAVADTFDEGAAALRDGKVSSVCTWTNHRLRTPLYRGRSPHGAEASRPGWCTLPLSDPGLLKLGRKSCKQ